MRPGGPGASGENEKLILIGADGSETNFDDFGNDPLFGSDPLFGGNNIPSQPSATNSVVDAVSGPGGADADRKKGNKNKTPSYGNNNNGGGNNNDSAKGKKTVSLYSNSILAFSTLFVLREIRLRSNVKGTTD